MRKTERTRCRFQRQRMRADDRSLIDLILVNVLLKIFLVDLIEIEMQIMIHLIHLMMMMMSFTRPHELLGCPPPIDSRRPTRARPMTRDRRYRRRRRRRREGELRWREMKVIERADQLIMSTSPRRSRSS
jgi:hypothetical protein